MSDYIKKVRENQNLQMAVQYLKGVGPSRAAALSKLGIKTIGDLVNYYPCDYQDRRSIKKISELQDGQEQLICAKVLSAGTVEKNYKLALFKAAVSDDSSVAWVNVYRHVNPYHKHNPFTVFQRDFTKGVALFIWGSVQKKFGKTNILLKDYEKLMPENEIIGANRIVPVYSLTSGIKQKWLRELIYRVVEQYSGLLEPVYRHRSENLLTVADAIKNIHFPADYSFLEAARKTLAFEEFIIFQVAMMLSRKYYGSNRKSHGYSVKKTILTPFKNALGFEFTAAQKKVINEIFADMMSLHPMNRVLIGDVGCGKTVVALSALLLAVENGYQAALMAPTEILAEQHYKTISGYLKELHINVTLLTGRAGKKKHDSSARSISSGDAQIVIGTHALIEERVTFSNLKLVVIDEQHRFGVNQRLMIKEKSNEADVLLMSATPIPRTLALTIYGDLDISYIDELPPGRRPIKTLFMDETEAYEFAKKELRSHNQVFIVYPLVDDSEKLELKSAIQEARRLSRTVFNSFNVAVIHGKLKSDEKQKIMRDFREKKINILIATVVIEVGIDIPSATVIIVEHSERYGLATLHQLRGRVGRGEEQSYFIMVGNPQSERARERINVLQKTNDGFEVARADLKLRGSGEILSTYQHGELNLKIGDIERDKELIEHANITAKDILSTDPELVCHKPLRNEIMRRYSGKVLLGQVG